MYLTGTSTPRKLFAATGALLGWITLILQFYLMMNNRIVSLPETTLRFFSYFTILTNTLVAITYTVLWVDPPTGRFKALTRVSALTAVTVYILIVGIIYNVILRALWEPKGLQYLVDEALHTVIPLLFFIFWLVFVPKASLEWRQSLSWLGYPIAYVLYILILGAITRFYPYPFADAGQLGYPRALLNGLGIVAAFFLLSLLLIALGKRLPRKQ